MLEETKKKIKPQKTKTTKEIFGFPLKTFRNSEDLRKMMLIASDNTLFLIGENEIRYPEGDSKIELVWAKVFRTCDSH